MAAKQPPAKDLANKDGSVTKMVELATQDVESVEELVALFDSSGVKYTSGEELTGDFKFITGDEKQLFLERVQGREVFCISWQFRTPENGTREYVSVHVFVDGHGKFIVNDSAQGGFYGQLSDITSQRLEQGWEDSRARAGLHAARGFKKNPPFFYDDRTKKAIPRDQLESIPAEHKHQAKPTWRLVF